MSVSSSQQQNLHDYQLDFSAFVGVHKVVQANDKSECEQVYYRNYRNDIGDRSSYHQNIKIFDKYMISQQGAVEEILRSTDRN